MREILSKADICPWLTYSTKKAEQVMDIIAVCKRSPYFCRQLLGSICTILKAKKIKCYKDTVYLVTDGFTILVKNGKFYLATMEEIHD
jgi:hypothetical protein